MPNICVIFQEGFSSSLRRVVSGGVLVQVIYPDFAARDGGTQTIVKDKAIALAVQFRVWDAKAF